MDDNGLVCVFHSLVGCLTCETAIMISWRPDGEIAGPAKAAMEAYRSGHLHHDLFFEGVPGISLVRPDAAPAPGITLVRTVKALPDPNDPAAIIFGPYGHLAEYAHVPRKS